MLLPEVPTEKINWLGFLPAHLVIIYQARLRHRHLGQAQVDLLAEDEGWVEDSLVLSGGDSDEVDVYAVGLHLLAHESRDSAEEGDNGGDFAVPAHEARDAGAVTAEGFCGAVRVLHAGRVEHVLVPGKTDGLVEEEGWEN